jgi:hypothetical protein
MVWMRLGGRMALHACFSISTVRNLPVDGLPEALIVSIRPRSLSFTCRTQKLSLSRVPRALQGLSDLIRWLRGRVPWAAPLPGSGRHRASRWRPDFFLRSCPSCSGRMKILTALIKPGSVRAYLDGVGLPSRAPPIALSRLDR